MRLPVTSLLALTLLGCKSAPGPIPGTQADPAAHEAILATIDRLFVAMAARDQAAFAACLLDQTMIHSLRQRNQQWQLRSKTAGASAADLGVGDQRLLETYWQPTVLQRGPIAVVWAPYRFQIDGRDSHYGVDVFDLVQVDGTWRIANLVYTVEAPPALDLAPGAGAVVRPRQ
ncbi:MAG: hypothetical protein JNK49_20940 [Planctomycetes bacterium]|nr:hypothetical protein [Planctomycetota bacterium]